MPTENQIPELLNVERSTVTKLVITGAPRLDPITVFLEDFGRRDCPTEQNPNYQTAQGKIPLNCWDKNWSAYWGGMGPRTVAEFVANCDWHYVQNCLNRAISDKRFTGDGLNKILAYEGTPDWLKRAIRLGLLSLQRREHIVIWPKSAVDLEQSTIKVSPGKTQNYGKPVHLEIVMGQALREVVMGCKKSPVVCPYLIHYSPKARSGLSSTPSCTGTR